MARVEIDLPERFSFSTEIKVRMADVNMAGHVGSETLVSFLNEAQLQFVQQIDFGSVMPEGVAFINADTAVIYRSESFYGDTLKIEAAANDFHKYGCDIVFRVTNKKTKQEIVIAKAGMLFYNYDIKKVAEIPAKAKDLLVK